MHKFLYGAALSGVLFGFSACSDENPWTGAAGEGAILLNLTADGNVKDAVPATRAEELFTVPETEEFSILLEKTDGSYSKTFETVADFKNETSFPSGSYKLTAFYGKLEDEGFDMPYFEGTEQVTVMEATTAEVSVTASVSNSLVSIEYTDAFKNYLSDYSATVHSEGYGYHDFHAKEDRPVFVVPGEVGISVTFSNPQGKSVTIQPASFNAKAGCHYHVTFDVNDGEVGTAQLKVIFDSNTDSEDVIIDLSDELFDSPAPKVNAVNFTSGDEIEFLAGEAPDEKYKFNVISYGGLEEVNLTLNSTTYTNPVLGREINLIGASNSVQEALSSIGIDAKGVYGNVDRMALVDVSNLAKNLPAGKHEIIISAKDKFMRVSEPVNLIINSVAPDLSVQPQSALYGMNIGSLIVTYNGSHPETDITFKAVNKWGKDVDCEVKSVDDATRTRSIESKNYIFTITVPDTERESAEIPVKVYLYGKQAAETKLDVVLPKYSVTTDAFAKKVMIKIEADENQIAAITENLKVYNDNSQISDAYITRNIETGIVTVSGLEPETLYTSYSVSLISPESDSKSLNFTTEAATDVPNGNFEEFSQTINISNVNVGGKYYLNGSSSVKYQYKSSITANTPANWGNLNSLTCNPSSSEKNTWYMVPSTYRDDQGKIVVRSVGYNNNGNGNIEASGSVVLGSHTYYCQNAPSDLIPSVGKLFLGNSEESGISFSVRPLELEFGYSYAPEGNETASAIIKIYSKGEQIGSGNMTISSGNGKGKMAIKYIDSIFGKKADAISIVFVSSTSSSPAIHIPTGSELDEGSNSIPLNKTLDPNTYHAYAKGSVLTIDNVKLNY